MATQAAIVIRRTTDSIGELVRDDSPMQLAQGQWGFATADQTLVIRDLEGNFHAIKTEDAMLDSMLVKSPVQTTTALPSSDQTGTLRMVLDNNSYWFKTASNWVRILDTANADGLGGGECSCDPDPLKLFTIESDGNGGYNLSIKVRNHFISRNLPPADHYMDGIMTAELWQRLMSLRVEDIEYNAQSNSITVYFVNGSSETIQLGGGGGSGTIPVGFSSTSASTAAKAVTISNVTVTEGTLIAVSFSTANTATGAMTLNVTDSTGTVVTSQGVSAGLSGNASITVNNAMVGTAAKLYYFQYGRRTSTSSNFYWNLINPDSAAGSGGSPQPVNLAIPTGTPKDSVFSGVNLDGDPFAAGNFNNVANVTNFNPQNYDWFGGLEPADITSPWIIVTKYQTFMYLSGIYANPWYNKMVIAIKNNGGSTFSIASEDFDIFSIETIVLNIYDFVLALDDILLASGSSLAYSKALHVVNVSSSSRNFQFSVGASIYNPNITVPAGGRTKIEFTLVIMPNVSKIWYSVNGVQQSPLSFNPNI
ncbi:MAG: hypothetical protein LBQ76_04835 [Candidatus Fibromonas sp.]|nr:hypothetical protein [Candidatus Fibromonas sp.]